MAKYSGSTKSRSKTALKTTDVRTNTFEGAPAWEKDAHTALFTLAATSLTGENTFYESAQARDSRLQGLVKQLTEEDPEFIRKLVPWLRNVANMRSAPLVIAAEYALAGGQDRRKVIDSALARGDEPSEFIGYYLSRTGRSTLPGGIQRGVADAVQRLYNEFNAQKWDSGRHDVRMGDVIELTHPKPKADWQGELYRWLLDRRHNPTNVRANMDVLPMIAQRDILNAVAPETRRAMLKQDNWDEVAEAAGITWEFLSGWLPGGMDKEAWEAVIPRMGYMALLRNLRNFDEAGISPAVAKQVADRLSDPEAVAKSRQFPFRFWSAWQATQSVKWGSALETALDLSTQNIPSFEGSTLVAVDVSGSMTGMRYSERGSVSPSDLAALFGSAVFYRNPKSTRVIVFGTSSADVTPNARGSMLRHMDTFRQNHGVGHGTTFAEIERQYKGEDRVVVFTDMQAHDRGASGLAKVTHYFDLGGYNSAPDPVGVDGTFMYAGFTDATFRHMKLNEMARNLSWDDILATDSLV